MRFTNSPYEAMMKKTGYIRPPAPAQAPEGSRCHGCPYWQGIACLSCYRDLLNSPRKGGR